ncbi:MAG: FAD-dependent oxidoreductase, partial [Oscillospiraceae bacterium]
KKAPNLCFAGQVTGVEGYVESTASGFLAAVELANRLQNKPPLNFPQETAIGALALYISNEGNFSFQPMNVNFGILPPLDHRVKGKKEKNTEIANRALAALAQINFQA